MKIGIITHYYKSRNYGGNLQAYALVRFLNQNGFEAEQISYDRSNDKPILKRNGFLRNCFRFLRHLKNKDCQRLLPKEIIKRYESIQKFNDQIPHSKVIRHENLDSLYTEYDTFICGSDQVWHPSAVCDAYLLNFKMNKNKRIAYAASFSVDSIDKSIEAVYQNSLEKFNAISVREEKGKEIIDTLIGEKVECVLDPTLLLSPEEWDSVCEDIQIDKKYILCYFLGGSEKQRECASKYAREKNCKILTLPFLLGKYRRCDENFGDTILYDVSPGQLLTLIKNAEFIFCDSFHITVFSILFHKDFIIFPRSDIGGMCSRIHTLLSLFDLNERLCEAEDKCTADHIEKLGSIDYKKRFTEFDVLKEKSVSFLMNNLKQ